MNVCNLANDAAESVIPFNGLIDTFTGYDYNSGRATPTAQGKRNAEEKSFMSRRKINVKKVYANLLTRGKRSAYPAEIDEQAKDIFFGWYSNILTYMAELIYT